MGKSKELFCEVRTEMNMIQKNTRLGGYNIYPKPGIEIWIAGTLADAKRELRNELKTK